MTSLGRLRESGLEMGRERRARLGPATAQPHSRPSAAQPPATGGSCPLGPRKPSRPQQRSQEAQGDPAVRGWGGRGRRSWAGRCVSHQQGKRAGEMGFHPEPVNHVSMASWVPSPLRGTLAALLLHLR